MSELIRNKGGGMIVWDSDDWAAGLMVGVGTAGIPPLKSNLGARTLLGIDPYRNYGYLSPGSFPAEATNSSELAGAVVAGVVSSADADIIYGIDVGGKIQKLTYSTNVLTTSFHTIAGTTPVGQDCIIYKHNSGGTGTQVASLFYSYYQSVNWNVGAYVNLSSFDDVFLSGTPATPLDIAAASPADGKSTEQRTQPHPMCVGSDDILYIGSGRYLHSYDGTSGANGTFHSKVLSLPAGFVITGLCKYNDLLLIAGNYAGTSGEATVYVWNYIDLDTTQIIPLKDPTVSSIFIWRGEPHVITYGSLESRGQIRLKRIVGNTAVKITDFNQQIPPVFRGIDSIGQTLYVNCGGNIVSVGNILTDIGYSVNNITYLASILGSGWLKVIPDVNFTYIASATNGSTTYRLSKFVARIATGYNTATYRSGYVEPVFPPGFMGRVRSVMVMFRNTVTAEATKNFAVILDTDFNTVATNVLITTSVAAPLTKRFFLGDLGVALPTFQNISLDILWQNGAAAWLDYAAVSKVIVEFEDIALLPNS